MKTKEKVLLKIVGIVAVIMLAIAMKASVYAQTDDVGVKTPEEFIEAIKGNEKEINITADMDLSRLGAIDVSGKTINLNQHTIKISNSTTYIQGTNFIIKNGTFDSKKGSYALFIGDEGETDNVILDNLTLIGGINIYNTATVKIRNTTIIAEDYYAIWCDQNGHAIIESGTFQAKESTTAVIGMSSTMSGLEIHGGNFKTNGKSLVLKGSDKNGPYGKPVFSGGIVDVEIEEIYRKEGYESVQLANGYSVCNHAKKVTSGQVEATCIREGYSGDISCDNCNKLIQKGEAVPMLSHNPSDWKLDNKYHWKECKDCKTEIEDSKKEHTLIDGKCKICSYQEEKKENSLVNTQTNVKVEFNDNAVPSDTMLEVEAITKGETYEQIKEVLPKVKQFILLDINLLRNGTKIQPNGKVTVNIPVPENFDTTKLVVYRVDGKEKIEYSVKVITDKNIVYAQFETDHFSNYVLAEEITEKVEETEEGNQLDDEPKTGTISIVVGATILLSISIVGYIISKKKMYQ